MILEQPGFKLKIYHMNMDISVGPVVYTKYARWRVQLQFNVCGVADRPKLDKIFFQPSMPAKKQECNLY